MAWLDSWNAGLANFIAPSSSFAGSGLTEDQIKAAQQRARMQMAAGLLSGIGSGNMTLARGISAGLQGAAASNESAIQNAYRNTLMQKQMDREARLAQAQEAELQNQKRTRAAVTASRIAQGMESATDPQAYWGMVQRMPEVQEMMSVYGLSGPPPAAVNDTAVAVGPPAQIPDQFRQQLQTYGQVGTPEAGTDDMREWMLARSQGYKGTFEEYQTRMKQAGAVNVNLGAQGLSTPPTGFYRPEPMKPGLAVEPGGPVEEEKKKETETTRTAAGFLVRMQNAETLLGNYVPSAQDYMAATALYSGGGSLVATAANQMMTPAGQKYYQAAADWVRAKLRKESGAVIGPEEMQSEIRTYFPLPGDDAGVVRQKAQARATAIAAMNKSAAASADIEPTAIGPNGEVIVMRGGKWVSKSTGKEVKP